MAEQTIQQGLLNKTTPLDRGFVELPQLTPHLEFHIIEEQQVLLISESFNTLLHGQLTVDLLPLLDGRHTRSEIQATLQSRYPASSIQSGIQTLSNKGYIVSGNHQLDASQAAYWATLGASPRYVEQRLKEVNLVIRDGDSRLETLLKQANISLNSVGEPDLAIVICDDYLSASLSEVNRDYLQSQTSWILVRPHGVQPLLGPVFPADSHGPCWSCLNYRQQSHQEVHTFLRNFAGEEAAFKPTASIPVALDAIYAQAAAEILKWVVLQGSAPVHEHVIAINAVNLEISKHRVTRRPQCLACGDELLTNPNRSPLPLNLQPSPKKYTNSGGSRTVSPEETLARYRHLISPIAGVVSWLTRTTDEMDSWLHVYWAGSNLGMRSRTLSSLRRSLRSKSAGKGSTSAQSEASALCEAIERYSGGRHGDEICLNQRLCDFKQAGEAIHPNEVQLFSDLQFDNAAEINAEGHPYNVIPSRLNDDIEIDWTPVWSLTNQRHRYLPTSMLYSMPAELRGNSDLIADSNGCAAGNTVEEAILQGFYELVERDAFSIWWYNQLRVPAVEMDSFNDEFLSSANNYYAKLGRDIWLIDVTADIPVPTFVAVSRKITGDTDEIIFGAGSHLDPRIAALRAVCELNQCLTWLPRPGSQSNRPMIDDPLALWWWSTIHIDDCPWLAPIDHIDPKVATDFSVLESDDSQSDIIQCRRMIEDKGLEMLVLDQTRPDIEMPVVRVIVPGMRHFWARFAPGRLYDVPVNLGLLEASNSESELNPLPVIA